jgi:hypothetical protein
MESGGARFIVEHDGAVGAEPWQKSGEPARRSFRRRWERPRSVPASVLVCWASGSPHHDPAGFRGDEPDHRCLRPNTRVPLSGHGLCDAGDRTARVFGVVPTSGLGLTTMANCSSATMAIAVRARVKVLSWMTALQGGSIDPRTLALWAIGFIFVFSAGGKPGKCEFRNLGD